MTNPQPNIEHANLVLRLYELRREPVMRESRDKMLGQFFPKSYEDFFAVTQFSHPFNAAFRQVSSYWEMVYNFARAGVIPGDFLLESGGGEGLFFYVKIRPFIERYRKEGSPTAFSNTEWLCTHSVVAQQRLEVMQKRIAQMMEAPAK